MQMLTGCQSCRMRQSLVLSLFGLLTLSMTGPAVAQYYPEHPKVQAMVDRGVAFLEKGWERALGGDYDKGTPILVGYTILKATGDVEHPLVKKAIASARDLAGTLNSRRQEMEGKIIYESAIAAVLLASADAAQYRPELNEVLYFYQQVQKSHGGFGYLGRQTGDTSQVQYVMLALWTMKEVDIEVPADMVERTLQYLKATMDPSGSWGYQGKLGNGRLVAQEKASKSLGTAGIGAVIIGGDILGFYGARKKPKDENEDIPAVFVRIDLREQARRERKEVTMSRADTDGAINLATRYQNTSQFGGGYWYYYWRYSQERYESFVEIVNGRQEKSPAWYNQGVEELARVQDQSGGWGEQRKSDITPPPVCTSFAILFLIRSTQKAIGKIDEAIAFGGYELPTDVSNVRMMGNKIVSSEETSVANLLEMLEDDEASGVQMGLLPDDLQLTSDPVQRKEQIARLSRLLVSQDWKARRIAAKLLGRSEDLAVGPDLIFALTDPDEEVPLIAEESLRLLSRKLKVRKLSTPIRGGQREAAEEYWKEWYLGLYPEHIFIDR